MILKAIIDDQELSLNVPDTVIAQGGEFFARLDADMDAGWQMSREWVQNPSPLERCQIVADKLLTAMQQDNNEYALLMAAYILHNKPGTRRIRLNIEGEIQGNEFLDE